LQNARIKATWAKPPSADDVTQRDDERLLANPLLTETIREDETAFVRALLPGAQRRTGGSRLPAPVSCRPLGAGRSCRCCRSLIAQAPRSAKNFAPRDEHPSDRGPISPMASGFSLSVGRKQNAEPRWLIPMICRAGELTKRDIGAIRMQPEETYVELSGAAAERFLGAIGPNLTLEKGIRVKPMSGAPRYLAPEP
jgi:ATP-dependent RNA helicase DeaD